MANILIHTEDSTLFAPRQARALAWCAVSEDEMRTPQFLRTLAWTHYYDGSTDQAALWMERALALSPRDSSALVEDLEMFRREQQAGPAG